VTSALGYTPFHSGNFSTWWGGQTGGVTSAHLANTLDMGTLT
jgi:coenzyme F420-reducing hydrogenase beta subunit